MTMIFYMIFYGRSMKIFPHGFYLIKGNARLQSCFLSFRILIYIFDQALDEEHTFETLWNFRRLKHEASNPGIIDIDVH